MLNALLNKTFPSLMTPFLSKLVLNECFYFGVGDGCRNCIFLLPSLDSLSASSFPRISQWDGIVFVCETSESAFYSVQLVLERKGNVLFNDALNTFYLRLYGVGLMVMDHSDSERRNPLPPHGLLFPINSKGSFICTIPHTG